MTTLEKQNARTVVEAVAALHADMSLNDEIMLALINEGELIDAYFSLGLRIRHEFGLWTDNNALLESCRIVSGDKNLDADTASMMIVRALWEKVKSNNILQD